MCGGHIGDRPASVPVAARRRRGTDRGQTRLRPRHAGRSRCTPPTVRRDLKVAAAPLTPTERGRQPANSPRRQAAASRPHPKPVVQDAPGSSPRVRNAARPCPSRNRTSPLRATAPSPSRVAPARGIPMADSTRAHRGPPPAVVGQLADDGGGRRSPPGPCAHQARGLRFEGAAARAEPRSFSRSP
jgi:hypothetical protein